MFPLRCSVCHQPLDEPFTIERDGCALCGPCAEAYSADAPGLPIVHLDECELDPAVVALIPRLVAYEHCAIPLAVHGKTLTVAVARPSPDVLSALRRATKLDIEPVLALQQDILLALRR